MGFLRQVLIAGATLNSLCAEFVRVVLPYADTICIAGRSEQMYGVFYYTEDYF